MDELSPSLVALAQGGGCGCKLPPATLRAILSGLPSGGVSPDLLVGRETADDAAVLRIGPDQALVSTTDFFTPIVDDPFDFGRIAAANALSDVYAMGGRPVLALALLGMPASALDLATARRIMEGGAAICLKAGVPVAGGHSIDSPALFFGLAVSGLVHPERVLRNHTSRPGDVLILTKPLGIGVLAQALRAPELPAARKAEIRALLLETTTALNRVGMRLADMSGVHAATDVTGFGLLGHLLEMCHGAHLGARLDASRIPMLRAAEALAAAGIRTGAAPRNWRSYGGDVAWPEDVPGWRRDLLCDPQTSGGLLIAVAPDRASAVCSETGGYVIGDMIEGKTGICFV